MMNFKMLAMFAAVSLLFIPVSSYAQVEGSSPIGDPNARGNTVTTVIRDPVPTPVIVREPTPVVREQVPVAPTPEPPVIQQPNNQPPIIDTAPQPEPTVVISAPQEKTYNSYIGKLTTAGKDIKGGVKAYGSKLGKVCGSDLCRNSVLGKNIDANTFSSYLQAPGTPNKAFDRALENTRSLAILRDYYAYKQISFDSTITNVKDIRPIPIQSRDFTTNVDIKCDTSAFEGLGIGAVQCDAPAGYSVERPIKSFVKFNTPGGLFGNPDYPQYVKKVVVIPQPEPMPVPSPDSTETVPEMIVDEPSGQSNTEIPMMGICGEGTEYVNGACVVKSQ